MQGNQHHLTSGTNLQPVTNLVLFVEIASEGGTASAFKTSWGAYTKARAQDLSLTSKTERDGDKRRLESRGCPWNIAGLDDFSETFPSKTSSQTNSPATEAHAARGGAGITREAINPAWLTSYSPYAAPHTRNLV